MYVRYCMYRGPGSLTLGGARGRHEPPSSSLQSKTPSRLWRGAVRSAAKELLMPDSHWALRCAVRLCGGASQPRLHLPY